jgi:hypothetical protein
MTRDKENFLADLKFRVITKLDTAFREGDEDHKGDPHTFDDFSIEELCDELEKELIDGLTYLHKIRKLFQQINKRLID